MEFLDYYKALRLPFGASLTDIKKAYRKLSLQYHPDRNRDNPDSTVRQQRINEAYSILGDPKRKADYDAQYRNFRKAQTVGAENNSNHKSQSNEQSPPPPKYKYDSNNNYDSDRYERNYNFDFNKVSRFIPIIAYLLINFYTCEHKNNLDYKSSESEPNSRLVTTTRSGAKNHTASTPDFEFSVKEIVSYLNIPFKTIEDELLKKKNRMGKEIFSTSQVQKKLESIRAHCEFSSNDDKVIGFSITKSYANYALFINQIKKQGFKFWRGKIVITDSDKDIILKEEPQYPVLGAQITYKRKDGLICLIGRRDSEDDFKSFNADFFSY